MFDEKTIASISATLRAGEYNLLTGAGISLDSGNKIGTFPSGNDFRLSLCKLKGARENSSLQRVYSTLSPSEVDEFVVGRFKDAAPGPSVQKITKFLWRRIFTFNIDDALEAAYAQPDPAQFAIPYHFEDDYSEIRDPKQVAIVHLHGSVRNPEKGFVFSNAEYVRQLRKINPWMVVLTQFLPVEPFIIAGTSLEEVDLEFYLAHRTPISARPDKGPSILVEPHPDAATRKDCERYALDLFEGTTEELLDYLDRKVPNRPKPIDLIPSPKRSLFPSGTAQSTMLSFAADFEVVPERAHPTAGPSKFLFGHAPTWEDLEANLDIPREITAEVARQIDRLLADPAIKERFLILSDDTGTGKTDVLRRVAYDFARRRVNVIVCSALSRIDAQLTAEAIDLIDDPLLIIADNFADQAPALADMAQRLEKRDVALLCAERDYRSRYTTRAMSDVPFKTVSGLSLTSLEAKRLVEKFADHGLTGAADAKKNANEFAKRLANDPIAIASCRILNDFRPLDRIVESVCTDTNDRDSRRYLVASVALFCFRGGIRYEILAAIAGRDEWDAQFDAHHPMPLDYFEAGDKSYVVPLNPTMSGRILSRVAATDRRLLLDAFSGIALALAPYVNRGAIRRRTPEARMAGRLFDYDQVVSGFLKELAPSFYDNVREAWRWNSRYWEQVALMHLAEFQASPTTQSGFDALAQAVQHARHAVSIETHPLPLTTLGKILFAQMLARTTSRDDTFEEAFARVSTAIDLERSWSRINVQPFISMFRGVRDYLAAGGQLNNKQLGALQKYIAIARNAFGSDAEVSDVVAEIKHISN
jgi:hypothetical protein